MEWVFNIVFFIECVVKVIALGFIFGRTHRRSRGTSSTSSSSSRASSPRPSSRRVSGALPNLRMLRTSACCGRSSRSTSRAWKSHRRVLNSIPKLANVLFLLVFLLYIFSIIGITFFMGLQVRALRARSAPRSRGATARRASGDQSSPSHARRCSSPARPPSLSPPPAFSRKRSTFAAASRSGRRSGQALSRRRCPCTQQTARQITRALPCTRS